jgi:hypothetical protein
MTEFILQPGIGNREEQVVRYSALFASLFKQALAAIKNDQQLGRPEAWRNHLLPESRSRVDIFRATISGHPDVMQEILEVHNAALQVYDAAPQEQREKSVRDAPHTQLVV